MSTRTRCRDDILFTCMLDNGPVKAAIAAAHLLPAAGGGGLKMPPGVGKGRRLTRGSAPMMGQYTPDTGSAPWPHKYLDENFVHGGGPEGGKYRVLEDRKHGVPLPPFPKWATVCYEVIIGEIQRRGSAFNECMGPGGLQGLSVHSQVLGECTRHYTSYTPHRDKVGSVVAFLGLHGESINFFGVSEADVLCFHNITAPIECCGSEVYCLDRGQKSGVGRLLSKASGSEEGRGVLAALLGFFTGLRVFAVHITKRRVVVFDASKMLHGTLVLPMKAEKPRVARCLAIFHEKALESAH